MTIAIGSRLGPYEILSLLGVGGMGEVYRARDTRLNRIVAIKILPAHVAHTSEAQQRFEREARAVSALNHPNICTLHDIGSENGIDYLVLECIDGETLADRIRKGPLPIEQALTFAIQISDALDKAHRRGVVHRDLKPGNIMISSIGVKILDFGLAKIGPKQSAAVSSGGSLVETQTTPLTGQGSIIGTLQYMAPEQLEGKDADARTDIFAFGTVLYETLTGKRAFSAASQAGLISAIMSAVPPPVSSLRPVTPPLLDCLLGGCLEKDPDDRWQSAHDVAAQLKWIAASRSQAGVAARAATSNGMRNRVWIAAIAVLVALSGLAGVWLGHHSPAAELTPVGFTIATPEGETLVPGPAAPQVAISPDGRHLAFATRDSTGNQHLWVRALESFSAQLLDKTAGASLPFWSPDSRSIAFFADGKLKRIAASGGDLQAICDGAGEGGAWSPDGDIVFSNVDGRLYRVPATGGVATNVTTLDQTQDEVRHGWPQFLPRGRSFLYFAQSRTSGKGGIYVQKLDSRERTLLMRTATRAVYAPPNLLFLRDGTLMAQKLDLRSFAFQGEPLTVAEGINYNDANGRAAVCISENGVLVYRGGGLHLGGNRRLVWRTRDGKEIGTLLKPGRYLQMDLSPDERRLAIEMEPNSGVSDLWTLEISSGIVSRLTFGPESVTSFRWSRDSKRIAFAAEVEGKTEFRELTPGGSGSTQIYADNQTRHLSDWTSDGRFLVYNPDEDRGLASIALLPLDGERKPAFFLRNRFEKAGSRTSPDGRWIAYSSNESGKREVYVASFPSFREVRQVSTGGGLQPQWRTDGKELFYLAPNRDLMQVNIKSGSGLETSVPKALFRMGVAFVGLLSQYCVTKDGQRVLVLEPAATTGLESISVVLNWPSALKRQKIP